MPMIETPLLAAASRSLPSAKVVVSEAVKPCHRQWRKSTHRVFPSRRPSSDRTTPASPMTITLGEIGRSPDAGRRSALPSTNESTTAIMRNLREVRGELSQMLSACRRHLLSGALGGGVLRARSQLVRLVARPAAIHTARCPGLSLPTPLTLRQLCSGPAFAPLVPASAAPREAASAGDVDGSTSASDVDGPARRLTQRERGRPPAAERRRRRRLQQKRRRRLANALRFRTNNKRGLKGKKDFGKKKKK